jgi:hypothetical protein
MRLQHLAKGLLVGTFACSSIPQGGSVAVPTARESMLTLEVHEDWLGVGGLAAEGSVRVVTVSLDGSTIAAETTLASTQGGVVATFAVPRGTYLVSSHHFGCAGSCPDPLPSEPSTASASERYGSALLTCDTTIDVEGNDRAVVRFLLRPDTECEAS